MSSLLYTYGVAAGLRSGDFTTAERFLDNAASLPQGRVFRGHFHFMSSLNDLYRNEPSSALATARQAVALTDEAGAPFWRAFHRLGLAHALFACGQRREAMRHSAAARRLARSMRLPNIEFDCISSAAYFLLERGKDRVAVPLLRRTLKLARELGYVSRPFWMPQIAARLFVSAIEHGIEVDYVRTLIRRGKLSPPPEALHLEQWPFSVKIYTLGRFSVLIDGKPLEFSGKAQRKSLELLMALVAFGAREVSERQLTEALWTESEGDAAHQACASALHRLRKLLGSYESISLQKNHFSLDPRHVWVDAWAFERGLASRQGTSGAGRRDASDGAIALYRGPFLGKQVDLTWTAPLRERLRTKFLRHVAEEGRTLFAAREFDAAIALFEKGLNADPIAEELYHELMLCYQALGRRAEAIGVYQRCERTLAAALGVSPASKTVALYQALQS
jgi:DNA-binding SARP family transcriptional activator